MKKMLCVLILILLLPVWCYAGPLQERLKGVIAKKNVVGDVTPPTVSTANIATNGTTLTLAMSETVTRSGGTFDVDCVTAGNGLTATYSSGSGSNSLVYTIGTTVNSGDTCNLDYNGAANGIEDGAGNDLASITDKAVVNNSTQGSLASFSDDFNRADNDSLGANWTEVAGDTDISSNTMVFVTGSYGTVVVKHNTALTTVNQYIKVESVADLTYIGPMFRYTNSGSSYYTVCGTGGTNFGWFSYTGDGTGETQQGADTSLSGFSGPAFIGITVVGTGTDTVVRVWLNPTGDAPDSGGATWGSAAAGITWTSDPSNAVNTGSYIGFAGSQGTPSSIIVDNFFGGDIP